MAGYTLPLDIVRNGKPDLITFYFSQSRVLSMSEFHPFLLSFLENKDIKVFYSNLYE